MSELPPIVLIRKRKRPDGTMIWAAYVLEVDGFGTWLYTPQGSSIRGRRGRVRSMSYVGVPEAPGLPVLHLAPEGPAWWFASWAVDALGRRTSIDLCTPFEFDGVSISYEDLELDLSCRVGGVTRLDQEEFGAACASGLISETERTACSRTASEMESRLRRGEAPFDDLAWQRFDAALDRSLPALVDIPEP